MVLACICCLAARAAVCSQKSANTALTRATSYLSSKGKRDGLASIDSHDFLIGAYLTPPAQSAPLKASIHCACSLLMCFYSFNMCARSTVWLSSSSSDNSCWESFSMARVSAAAFVNELHLQMQHLCNTCNMVFRSTE